MKHLLRKFLRDQRGFTLVEMLIIIIVLAVIAVLLFSYLGNPLQKTTVQSSAVQIADNMRVIDEAWNQYYVQNTVEPTDIDTLLTSGILKSKPTPPSSAKRTTYSATSFVYIANTTGYDLSGSSANDTVVLLRGVTDDVCKKINHLYAGLNETSDIPNSPPATGKTIQCFKTGGADDNIVIKQIMAK